MSKGIETLKAFIASHRADKYPKIVEISKNAKPFKIDRKDPNFDKPISNLNKTY